MKKVLFSSLIIVSFIGFANAESGSAKVAATSYVQGAVQTRVTTTTSASNSTEVSSTGSGNIIQSVDIVSVSAQDTANKKLQVTKGRVQIPVGSQNATTYTPIWVE